MIRVLILSGVFPPDIGGPSAFLDPLARDLIKNGFKVRVLTFGKKEKKYPYPVKRVSNNWPGFLKSFIYLKWGLWYGLKSDIIYNQDLYTAGITALIIKKVLGKKLVTRFVGDSAWEKSCAGEGICDNVMVFQEKEYSSKIERWKKIRKRILSSSDKIIVASNFLKQVALRIGLSEEKIRVIYNSIDFMEINPSLSKEELKQKMGLKGKVLLTIARLTPWKGVDMLIKIMPGLIEKYGQINLIVAGRGSELENLKQLAENLKIENNVIFTGQADRQEVNDYLTMADIFLLNSNYEGMSHLLLESIKAGLPIITTPAGGNPETIRN
ncbi:MAG: glycosyltransferase family 4 protein, partial [Candidatus Portnoybacteria bacterium]